MENVTEEIYLVANIIDRLLLTNGSLRADQLAPLVKRLRATAGELSSIHSKPQHCLPLSPVPRKTKGLQGTVGGAKQRFVKLQQSRTLSQFVVAREQTQRGLSISPSRKNTGDSNVFVSPEVSESVCCALYNLLEGATRLLRASHGHIFVKRGDDMFSIANVSRKLTFPPLQVHHGCLGSADAEVLGSSIALNRHIDEDGRKSAVLIFPIYKNPTGSGPREPIATIHVERKEHAVGPFTENDECILYFASVFCSELMSRIPQLNFLEAFYDPSTQHIIAPFEPHCPVVLPPIEPGVVPPLGGPGKHFSEDPDYAAQAVSHLTQKMNAHVAEILVRRESLPSSNTKPFAPGVAHMPSMLEIQAYADNLLSCWRKNMSDNVRLLESDRGTQQDLKLARKELAVTRLQLATAAEKLRLYELDACDYKREYGAMKSELSAYLDGLERLH
ncbi:hypothetical protein LSCM1_00051 [Leishmania martiniquensis]|uniref:Uncharacterized protein n=1 Tax=Leishmania martiniquensis TaxID=1580590 RepID=A0A836GH94_9TRYP|nr:hypothetical protein LSCM1_00051 [Leishmania martiniquensis]